VAWRGDERFTDCSTFKLFLAAATLERVDRGVERLDAVVPVTAADMVSHAPTTGPAVGRTQTVEQLCQGTVELSDNPAANLLIARMGGLEAWRAWWPAIGDRITRVDRLEPELNRPDPVLDTATPNQTVRNLRTVLLGDRLSTASRSKLEGWLLASPTARTGSRRPLRPAPAWRTRQGPGARRKAVRTTTSA
jgi:beta-lactamase class A